MERISLFFCCILLFITVSWSCDFEGVKFGELLRFFAISRLKRIGNENISSAILESGDIEMLCDSDVGSVRVIFALPDRFYL